MHGVETFLQDNPRGPLWVVVGFASAFGLGWLDERTRGRSVRLLIGDTRKGFGRCSEDDRRAAVAFLRRSDVTVTNWYKRRGGYETVHAKAWMVVSDTTSTATAVLVGSANLTRQGLYVNTEVLTVAPASELARLHREMVTALDKSWDRSSYLLKRLGITPAARHSRRPHGPTQRIYRPAGPVPPQQGALKPGAQPHEAQANRGVVRGIASEHHASPRQPPPPPRLQRRTAGATAESRPRQWKRWALAVSIAVVALAALSEGCRTAAPPRADAPTASLSNPVAPADLPSAPVAVPETTTPDAASPAGESQSDSQAPDNPSESSALSDSDTTVAAEPEASPRCPYTTAARDDACDLLESLNGIAFTPCEALPLDARPLRLTGSDNPASYQTPSNDTTAACTWMSPGTYIAGETIPADDLRSLNSAVFGLGICQFELRAGGATITSHDSYAPRWATRPLIRLQPGDEITTSGCGWVPAAAARLRPGQVLSAATVGDYPLIVGVDIDPGPVRIECPFRLWSQPEPASGRDWDAGLANAGAERRGPGPHDAAAGSVIWLDCPATPIPTTTQPPPGDVARVEVIPGSLP